MIYYFYLDKYFSVYLVLLFFIIKLTKCNENNGNSNNSNSNNLLMIRHGRSRGRHSSEKNHIRWGLRAFDNLTLDYVFDSFEQDNDSLQFDYLNNSYINNSSRSLETTTQQPISTSVTSSSSSTIDFSHYFDYGQKVVLTETSKQPRISINMTLYAVNGTKRRLGKKAIMENIRKNVDKGLEYLKSHQNLREVNFTKTIIEKTATTTFTTTPFAVTLSPTMSMPFSNKEKVNENVIDGYINYQNDETREVYNFSNKLSEQKENFENDDDVNNAYSEENNDESLNDGTIIDNNEILNSNIDLTERSDLTDNLYRLQFNEGDIDLMDLDETSRLNRINLLKGRDVVTKFLQIVETQHLLGANCTAGTALNLGEGVVDRYAQDRFRVEADVAVNRANMLTRIFKLSSPAVQSSEHLLHASVLSMVEFDDDIFAAGNCFDWNQHPAKKGLFCPFAFRLPAPDHGASLAKDLAAEYHYLGNTSEWFFLARKNAEKVIARNEQYVKAYHLYTNSTKREVDEILSVKYEDGRWSKPYYDCGGGNIWMLTYTVPFFGYENGTYFFKGTAGIDIDLRRVDIDQCSQRNTGTSQPLNIFAGTDKCKQRTTECNAIPGLGFRRGSYRCVCRRGFYFPDTNSALKFFNGSTLEEEYEKFMLGEITIYNNVQAYDCLPCAEGCDQCLDASPCVAALNWPMRTSILVLACAIIGLLPPAVLFTFKYQRVKVVRAASPALLRVIALGAFFIYCTSIVMYPPPSLYTCTAKIWLREIGFSLTYGALMLKTWRISVIFRIRSAKAVKITDASLLKRLGILCCVISVALLVRTIVAPPRVVVGRTKDDLKAFLCKTDWWDHTFTSMEVLFLAWGVRLCIMVRKAPSEFNESRFISMAIYNEFLLTCFLNVSMLFLQSPANPDLLYIIFFCHTQLTVTLLLALIFGSKVYLVLRGGGKPPEESIGLGAKPSGAKFICRSQARTLAYPSTGTSSTAQIGGNGGTDVRLTEYEALDEIKQLTQQLIHLHDRAPSHGNAILTISSLLELCKTSAKSLAIKPQIKTTDINNISKIDKSVNTDTNFAINRAQEDCRYQHYLLRQQSTRITVTDNDSEMIKSEGNRRTSTSLCDLDFDNLELECMCNAADDTVVNTTPKSTGNDNCCTNNSFKFNKSFRISCKKNLHNFRISASTTSFVRNQDESERTYSYFGDTSDLNKTENLSVSNNNHNFVHICNNAITNNLIKNELDSNLGKLGNNKKIEKNLTLNKIIVNNSNLQQSSSSMQLPKLCCSNNCDIVEKFEDDYGGRNDIVEDSDKNSKMVSCNLSGNCISSENDPPSPTSTTSGSTKHPKNENRHLVLDLNDRSKYTKEVSV